MKDPAHLRRWDEIPSWESNPGHTGRRLTHCHSATWTPTCNYCHPQKSHSSNILITKHFHSWFSGLKLPANVVACEPFHCHCFSVQINPFNPKLVMQILPTTQEENDWVNFHLSKLSIAKFSINCIIYLWWKNERENWCCSLFGVKGLKKIAKTLTLFGNNVSTTITKYSSRAIIWVVTPLDFIGQLRI